MKRVLFVTVLLSILLPAADVMAADGHVEKLPAEKKESAIRQELKNHFKFYGFMRNYFAFDTRESVASIGDLFYYLPKDRDMNADGSQDLNQQTSFRFLSLTTRLGVDVSGYQVGRTKFGAKVETDFYAGVTGTTGTALLRLRQAYATIGWDGLSMGRNTEQTASVYLKLGQAWHPVAADQPHVTSLETGAPFNAFSRTPQVMMDASLGKHFILSAGALWQMQYTSTGPGNILTLDDYAGDVSSADYIKYSCIPEMYLGISYRNSGFLGRVGASVLSIKPRRTGVNSSGTEVKVSDRITTVNPYIYLQYTGKNFEVKAKTIYSQGGEHMNLMSGYGVTGMFADGHWEYAPMQASSTWASVSYGKKWQVMLMGGYIRNLGATEDFIQENGRTREEAFYFSKNGFKNLNSMWRILPTVAYNMGKFTLAMEYNMTAAQYGETRLSAFGPGQNVQMLESYSPRGLATDNLHWVYNHRIQMMVRFTF